jgi:hypothetical protein
VTHYARRPAKWVSHVPDIGSFTAGLKANRVNLYKLAQDEWRKGIL